jgi:hypothetical protein
MRKLKRAVKACLRPLCNWLGHPTRLRPAPFATCRLAADAQDDHAPEYVPFPCSRPFRDEDLRDDVRKAARQRLGMPEDRQAIITLGHAGACTGSFECLWALEQLHSWDLAADLYFVGPTSTQIQPRLVQEAQRLHISDHVCFRAADICDNDYLCYLLSADFAIHLRQPGPTQPSLTLLDCISAGLPTVCNEELAGSLDCPGYVLRIPNHISPLLIAEQIADAHKAGRHYQRCSAARSAFVRDHSFERCAEELMKALKVA